MATTTANKTILRYQVKILNQLSCKQRFKLIIFSLHFTICAFQIIVTKSLIPIRTED